MLAASYQPNNNVAQVNNQQTSQIHSQNPEPNLLQQQQPTAAPSSIQTMRLRDDPPPITTPAPRNSRKRKSPPSANTDQTPQPQQLPTHSLPAPHTMVHPPPHMQSHPLQQGYQYDYSPSGMPVAPNQASNQSQMADHEQSQSPPNTAAGRALSSSKRAEQNRKAQRAFRERRDQ
jgi:hypothetical protein